MGAFPSIDESTWSERTRKEQGDPNSKPNDDQVDPNSKPNDDQVDPNLKPKKKICCACPDTKKLRDECIVERGESACAELIEAHRKCLRSEGFNV